MKRIFASAAIVITLIVAGCVPSLNSWYAKKDVDFDKALLGVWKQRNGDSVWTFSQSKKHGKDRYDVLVETKEKGGLKKARLTGTLAKIGGARYLDLTPAEGGFKDETSLFYAWHLVPAHTLQKVETSGGTLKIAMMNLEWMKKHLKDHPDALPHVNSDDRPVLTASTAQLQAFLAKHKDDSGFFGKPLTLEKQ